MNQTKPSARKIHIMHTVHTKQLQSTQVYKQYGYSVHCTKTSCVVHSTLAVAFKYTVLKQ